MSGYTHNMTREEIAAHFGISLRTVARLLRRRKIPCLYVGRNPRFSAEECERYFEANQKTITRRAA